MTHDNQYIPILLNISTFFSPRHASYFVFSFTERPKIWLPRSLRQTLIRKVGETVNLVIPFQVQCTFKS